MTPSAAEPTDLPQRLPTRALVDRLIRAYPFPEPSPDPSVADRHGLLAYGGDLSAERLLSAYAQGVFPWYDEDPILWFSPDPRMVLPIGSLHVSRSLARRERQAPYAITLDTAFERVIRGCRDTPRPGQSGTWINEDMVAAYCRLHELGFAHSVEAWSREDEAEGVLVGGLYGISLGRVFFGESMFARAPDASKLAFVRLMRQLARWHFELVDCQVRTEHLARFGAIEWTRTAFLEALDGALEGDTRVGRWRFD